MHFRLTPKGMTLDNFEHQNTGFILSLIHI